MAKKAKLRRRSPSARSKVKKNASWQERCQESLQGYLKKTKAAAGSLTVLGSYGDQLIDFGKKISVDPTTLGSLAASVAAAGESLGKFLKLSGQPIQFGAGGKKGAQFWFARLNPDYLLVGIRCPLQEAELNKLIASLKKDLANLTRKESHSTEALDGLTLGGVESQIGSKI